MSSWSDAVALCAIALALLLSNARAVLPAVWLAFVGLAAATAVVQTGSGKIYFWGDAWMAVLYLFAFLAAVLVGYRLRSQQSEQTNHGLEPWAIATAMAAIVSVGIATVQWTLALNLGIWMVDLAPWQRPSANVGQPNHFSTICFLGLTSLGYLHQRRCIGVSGFWLGAAWMMVGIVLSGSRTGWLQVVLLAGFMWVLADRSTVALPRRAFLALLLLLCGIAALWPSLSDALLLSEVRSAESTVSSGTRPQHWASMIEALAQQPWTGYGWQQVSAAQFQVAADRPWVGEFIEHSHNLVLDLLIWNGIPIGLVLVAMVGWWFVTRWGACRDGQTAWLLAGASGLLVHALLEYPLDYAYFLIPFGLLIGAIDQGRQDAADVRIGLPAVRLAGVVFVFALLATGREVAEAEQSFRVLRLEAARIGVDSIQSPEPDLRLLTQLLAFQRFVRREAKPNMTSEELDEMRKVAERFGQASVLFRYALATGLNGDPSKAARTLEGLCRMHTRQNCLEAVDAWHQAQRQYPALQAVAAPQVPPSPAR